MDVKKRKREMLSDQLSEDEDEDGDCKVKRRIKHLPDPPSPPEDSNDREVSMIFGHSTSNNRESPNYATSTTLNQSEHYSKHSSLHTDLSLTPSPQQPLNINNQPDPEDSTENISSPDSEEDDHGLPETGFISKTVEESLSTPQNIQEPGSSNQLSNPEDDSDDSSPHFNTPEPEEPEEVSTISSTCITIRHSTPTTVQETNLTPQTDTSFHDDILNLSANINSSDLHNSPYITPCSKPCTINNNFGPGSRTPCSSIQDSPSYCSPSPVYSIPSPGSAFSIVINRRRESES